jgi:hypothetical protein
MGMMRAENNRAGRATALALALLLCGCSSSGLLGSSQPDAAPPAGDVPRPSPFRERMAALFSGRPAPAQSATEAEAGPKPVPSDDCPVMDVRSGASTYAVAAQGGDVTAANLRYQATIARTARECWVLGQTMTVKVGVQGRMILGPAGGPGEVEVPLRLALVREGVEPRTIWTKLYQVSVSIPPGQTNFPFVHIEEDLSFPMPKPAELSAYVVYVGFDPAGAKQPPKQPPKPAPKKPRAAG